jgi:hypothetical protein
MAWQIELAFIGSIFEKMLLPQVSLLAALQSAVTGRA